jgi:murein DD-endopeptidase MepM/ murein hydrolase activator NlpD
MRRPAARVIAGGHQTGNSFSGPATERTALDQRGDQRRGDSPTRPGHPSPGDGDALSYDPHSWFARPAPAMATTAAPATPGRDTRLPFALLASAAILAIGAVAAHHAYRPLTKTANPVAPVSSAIGGDSHRVLMIASAADIETSLDTAGIAPDEARAAAALAGQNINPAPGDLRLTLDLRGPHLGELELVHDTGAGVTVAADGHGGFAAQRHGAHLTTTLQVVRGTLDAQSFYSSAVAAGVNDNLVSDFANAFAFDFDLQREVAPGDVIAAGFEQRTNDDGQAVGLPTLLYASLKTKAKSRALYRFTDPATDKTGWYDADGRSTVRALMRTPIDGARISSPFGMREHPILGFVKMHKGTDFAAPVGTPIFAAGDGVVEFAGLKGPNGNFVKLRHDNGWETLYLHMNRIWPGVAPGARVSQGQQIGEVGTTGRSTGPHLHYEVHVGGEPVDPLSLDAGAGTRALGGRSLAAFRQLRDRIDAKAATAG